MSKKYKFADNDKIYFVSFAVTHWIDLFIKNEYREEILNSTSYYQANKDIELYGGCIMTSHVCLNGTDTLRHKSHSAYLRQSGGIFGYFLNVACRLKRSLQ